MTKPKSRIPALLSIPGPRFYVAQYDEDSGEYCALHYQRKDGSWMTWHDTIEDAMSQAVMDFSCGEFVHCIYEVCDAGMTRHSFDPSHFTQKPEPNHYADAGSW